MSYAYLLINFLTVLFPVLLSFDKRVQFYKSWKYLLPAIAITGLAFLGWDILFTIKGVWSFNQKYVCGLSIYGLPIEEVLFFITVPFSCVFIYACLNYYFPKNSIQSVSKLFSNLLIVCSLIAVVIYHNRLYTLVTFSLLLTIIVLFQYIFKAEWLANFYRAFIISLIPFYIVNGALTSVPIVLYNDHQNMGIRLGTIPLEDHFYMMALLMMNIGLFEYFRRDKTTT
jgi:lycopene cyclase domain-containing protein